MKVRFLAISSLIAALYVAVSLVVAPLVYSSVQFRVPEMFNHLIVFNKKYFVGIVVGVFITNLILTELGPIDLVFGVGHSMLALSLTILSAKFIKGETARMVFNSFVFTGTMCIIAAEFYFVLGLPFLPTWGVMMLGEAGVMFLSIPVMKFLNKRLNFHKLIEQTSK